MIIPAGDGAPGVGPGNGQKGPTRALLLHLLRMVETRMDAARITGRSEVNAVKTRVQLKLFAAVALIVALWAGVVLIAVALPPHLRIPVLTGVVLVFAIAAVWAWVVAGRERVRGEPGSIGWFVDGLKQDLEVFARTLERTAAQAATQPAEEPPPTEPAPPPQDSQGTTTTSSRSPPSDIAA